MATKQFSSRIINKHDTEANWNLTNGFVPFAGETIVYDPDANHTLPRVKIGDGSTDVKLLPFTDAVVSVNNKTGAVTLNASDVGADPSGSASTVQGNLNTHTGNTTVHTNSTEKAAWNAKYDKPSGGIPKTDLASGVQLSLDKADTALQSAPVTSVNTKTGAVTLGKSDVGLGNVDDVQQYSASNPPPYPVTSVNSKTGAVTLNASDVGALPSSTVIHNVPSGGTTGQLLAKNSDTNYDVHWINPPSGGGGVVNTTYSALKALRDNGTLTPGTIYRMTDYSTIINGSYDLSLIGAQGYLHNAVSAGHDFDLLLLATDASHLSEDAKAVLHEGDTYFTSLGANLNAWEIKYDIDNDTNKYAWANTNGKGVIWWMKDEWNNQAGYDFKNIQFLRYALKKADPQGDYTPSATSLVYDAATQPNRYGAMYQIFTALQAYMQGGSYVNPWTKKDGKADYDFAVGGNILGVIQFPEPNAQYMSTFGADLYYTFDYYDESEGVHIDASMNTHVKVPCTENYISLEKDTVSVALFNVFNKLGLGGSVWETNSIYVAGLQSAARDNISHNYLSEHNWCNTFGDNCSRNTFGDNCSRNTFGDSCYSNTFGYNCSRNTFGDSCYSNTFGNDCDSNTFGDSCDSNTFGGSCSSNTFGDSCYSNTFGYNCYSNTFGDSCYSNTFGNDCDSNTFGDSCDSNTFGNDYDSNTFGNSCDNNTFGNSCYSNTFGNSCNGNTFGDSCYSNTFGDNCNGNTFGNDCDRNTFGKLDSNNNFIGNMWYLHCNDHVMGITATTTEYGTASWTIKVLESYNNTLGYATLITKTGHNQETAISTTDGGQTWA